MQDKVLATDGAGVFACAVDEDVGRARVTLSGELDIAGIAPLDRALHRAAAAARYVEVDLHQLEFIDLCGVRLLLAASDRMRACGGHLAVTRMSEQVERCFGLIAVHTGLEMGERLSCSP